MTQMSDQPGDMPEPTTPQPSKPDEPGKVPTPDPDQKPPQPSPEDPPEFPDPDDGPMPV
jgi:hypothetical protein